ncbi:MAG: peroxide stress protein YaaA [Crocinitomicaceae bacterium]
MKVILSPAKSLNEAVNFDGRKATDLLFEEESEYLAKKLKKLSQGQLKKLMSLSDDLAELNYERFQNWSLPFTADNAIPAGYMFSGAAYQTLDFPSLSQKEQQLGQDKLRILSGLYGLLRPLDLIQPYRLEMGTNLKVTPKVSNLYLFWKDKIREQLEKEVKADACPILVNAASNEYAKAAQLGKMDVDVITTIFKDRSKDGSYKVNMTWAKRARGLMARFVIQNNLEKAEDLKAFDSDGYYFSPKESTAGEFVYLRDKS